MEYTVIVNNKSYELPKRTISVMESLNAAMTVDNIKEATLRQKYQEMLKHTKAIIGAEAINDILGSEDVNKIDVSELELLVLNIKASYDDPIKEWRKAEVAEKLNALPVDKIVNLANAAKNIEITGTTS